MLSYTRYVTFLVALVAQVVAQETWTDIRERLRHPRDDWADEVAQRVAVLSSLQLTSDQQEAVAKWLRRPDVVEALAAADPADASATAGRIVQALKYELGSPSDYVDDISERIVMASIVMLAQVVAPELAFTVAAYRSLLSEAGEIKEAQAIFYVLLRELEASIRTTTALSTWQLVDQAFIDQRSHELATADLVKYFDGQAPRWVHATSSAIPCLEMERTIEDELTRRTSEHRVPAFLLVQGGAGEGKSTMLLQVAARLACSPNWVVHWDLRHSNDFVLDTAIMSATDLSHLYVFDDAERWIPTLGAVLSSLSESHPPPVVILLGAARAIDWVNAGGPSAMLRWSDRVECDDSFKFGELSADDAALVVEAWEKAGQDGLGSLATTPAAERVRKLVSATHRNARDPSGSFFGALLEVRFTAAALTAHVVRLMERLALERVNDKITLLDAFMYIAAFDALPTVDGLERPVLETLTGVSSDRMQSRIINRLADEAAGSSSWTALRIRHKAIARAAMVISDRGGSALDLSEIMADVVRATTMLPTTGVRLNGYNGIAHASPRLRQLLPQGLDERTKDRCALACAQAALDGDSQRLGFVVDYCAVLRGLRNTQRADARLRATAGDGFTKYVDVEITLRGFTLEWGITHEIERDTAEGVWVQLTSLADQIESYRLSLKPAHLARGLRAGVVGLDHLADRSLRLLTIAASALAMHVEAPGDPIELTEISQLLDVQRIQRDEALSAFIDGVQELELRVRDPLVRSFTNSRSFVEMNRIIREKWQ